MIRHFALVAAAGLIASDAFAADPPAAQAPAPVIGLGLSGLQWGMHARDVQAAYPTLGMHTELTQFRGTYHAFGCSFEISMAFHDDSLIAVYLDADNSECSKEVKASLLAQYGDTKENVSYLGIIDLQWNVGFMHVGYSQYPTSNRISIRFGDLRGAIPLVQ